MKKHLANTITILRIIGSVAILFFSLSSLPFYIIYLFCGFSDMIDGTIARKLNAVSGLGSKLDAISDFIFMVVCVVKLLPIVSLSIFLWIWIAIITIIKICNIVLGFVLRKKLLVLHTILNKTTGFFLFVLPLTLQFIVPRYSFTIVCIVATIAAIQEGHYIIMEKDK